MCDRAGAASVPPAGCCAGRLQSCIHASGPRLAGLCTHALGLVALACRCYPNSPTEFHGATFEQWKMPVSRPARQPVATEQQPQQQQPADGGATAGQAGTVPQEQPQDAKPADPQQQQQQQPQPQVQGNGTADPQQQQQQPQGSGTADPQQQQQQQPGGVAADTQQQQQQTVANQTATDDAAAAQAAASQAAEAEKAAAAQRAAEQEELKKQQEALQKKAEEEARKQKEEAAAAAAKRAAEDAAKAAQEQQQAGGGGAAGGSAAGAGSGDGSVVDGREHPDISTLAQAGEEGPHQVEDHSRPKQAADPQPTGEGAAARTSSLMHQKTAAATVEGSTDGGGSYTQSLLLEGGLLCGIAATVLWSRSRRRRGLPLRLGGRRRLLPLWGNSEARGRHE